MTVRELMEWLSQCDEDLNVVIDERRPLKGVSTPFEIS